ncbi:MAG: DUF1722 domain-containing protein, partial [Anaerolineae bacterium]
KQRRTHDLPFSVGLQATIVSQNKGVSHVSRTDGNIRPGQVGAKHVNVLQHLMGFLKDYLSSEDNAYLR